MRSCAAIAHRSLGQFPVVRPIKRPQLHLCPRPQSAPFTSSASKETKRMVAMEAISPVHIAIGFVGLAAVVAWVDAMLKSKKPELVYTASAFNKAVLSRCSTLHSVYQCTPFLTNGHAETIAVAKLRKAPGVDYRREIIVTKDGGAVAIDWEHHDDDGKDLPADAPVLILFPGLTGGSGDSYVQHAVLQARHAGIRAAVFNSRGTADSPVITPQFYSASFTDDTREVVAHVRKRYPDSTLFAAGWSLGANILVNYLGEQGADTPLEAAVSMCNPFDLTISNRYINEGFNKIYNWNLASGLKRIFMKHHLVWRGHPGPAEPHRVPTVKTIREFDEAITVHSFKWPDVDAYYAGSSSARRIPKVQIPLLCIQALDDPIAPAEAIPCDDIQANPNCVLAVTPCGGHLGWASGPGAPFNEPWTDAAVFEWLSSVHIELMKRKGNSNGNGSSSVRSLDSEVTEGAAAEVAVEAAAGKRQTAVADVAASSSLGSVMALAVDVSSIGPAAAIGQGSLDAGGLPEQQQHQQQVDQVVSAPAVQQHSQVQCLDVESSKPAAKQQARGTSVVQLTAVASTVSSSRPPQQQQWAQVGGAHPQVCPQSVQEQLQQSVQEEQQRLQGQVAPQQPRRMQQQQHQCVVTADGPAPMNRAALHAELVTNQLRWAF